MSKQGDALTINGTIYDFSPLPDGATLPDDAVACEYIIGDVKRVDGELRLTLLLPIAWDAPHEACFPAPIINPPDGAIEIPGGSNVN